MQWYLTIGFLSLGNVFFLGLRLIGRLIELALLILLMSYLFGVDLACLRNLLTKCVMSRA